MAMSVTIPNVEALDVGVWKAKLLPEDLHFLAGGATRIGPKSVLLLSKAPLFDRAASTLTFSPTCAKVLNLGDTADTMIVESRVAPEGSADSIGVSMPMERNAGSDAAFLSALPSNLRELGTELLGRVRAIYPGALKFFPTSGKFVETPDNFWTIRIQPRDASLRITVRGRPNDFVAARTLELKPDMGSYSSFKVSVPGQLHDFIKVLQQVHKKGRRS